MKYILLLLLYSIQTFAFIPKPLTIIAKASENGGSGVYLVEQEVLFQTSSEPLVLKEIWTIESADKMKLVVTGTKELKDKLKWVFIYDNGFRTQFIDNNKQTKKIDLEFIEKYPHIRKTQDLQNLIVQSKAVPNSLFHKNTYKPGKDPDVINSPFLRLARVGGVVTYAFGKATDTLSESNAAYFFEQDMFTLRKFRIGTLEVTADKFSNFARGLIFPRSRSIKWNENTVSIQTQQITPRTEKTTSIGIEQSSTNQFAEFGVYQGIIEEFYKRFR